MTRSIADPKLLEMSWNQQYARLSQYFSRWLPKQGVVVEIGCGKGQLTIPLSKRMPRVHFIGVDSFKGPYSDTRTVLSAILAERIGKTKIELVRSDYDSWLREEPDSKYDAIFSSEFLPEIDSKSMHSFLVECYRVLKPGGRTVHSFLSPTPRNRRQQRLIEADSNPRWTKTPPVEWFSPTEELVSKYLKLAGFTRLTTLMLRSDLLIRSLAAKELLRDWDIRRIYWKSHRTVLEKEGIEIPDWVIIGSTKRMNSIHES